MTKYYRVIKDNFLWEVGAILEKIKEEDGSYYQPIEDIWNKFKDQTEWVTDRYIEDSPEYFERVYKSEGEKLIFKTKDQLKKIYNTFISEDK